MTTYEYGAADQRDEVLLTKVPARSGSVVVKWMTSTDHKVIGNLYLITSFLFFLFGGVMALVIRLELWAPGIQIVQSKEQYNQLFTMHGTIMLLLFATPLFAGFANAIMPLQIGAPDVAFPRLNMFAYWMYLFGGLIACAGFLTPAGAAAFGWFAYAPLSNEVYSPGIGADLWLMGLALAGFGTILGAVNFITTIICMRAPGMTMFRMPIFTWNTLITSVLVLMAFPPLASALLVLASDRNLGSQVFDADNGGAILWQHLFWFFGHPEVYIIALPFFGIVSEVFPVFSRKPIFGYKTLVYATVAIAALSVTVWAHHMYVTGAVLLPFFAFMTMLIAVPTGVKIFNWIGTMFRGSLTFETPMLWAIGFLATFVFGGLTGVILSIPPLDFQLSDSYFVVAHFHYVVFGTVVFAMFSGFYFWWPKLTGRMLERAPGQGPLLDALPRLPRHVPHPALAGRDRHAPPVRGLLGHRRLHRDEPDLDGLGDAARRVDAAVPVERLHDLAERAPGRGRRPVGLRRVAGVGDVQPAARATTSRPCRGSGPSAPPSTCTTPRWRPRTWRRPTARCSAGSPTSPPSGGSSDRREVALQRRGHRLHPDRADLRVADEVARAGRRSRHPAHRRPGRHDRRLPVRHGPPARPPSRGQPVRQGVRTTRASRASSAPGRGGRCRWRPRLHLSSSEWP